jgi:hypothetical protein
VRVLDLAANLAELIKHGLSNRQVKFVLPDGSEYPVAAVEEDDNCGGSGIEGAEAFVALRSIPS